MIIKIIDYIKSKSKLLALILTGAIFLTPVLAFAQNQGLTEPDLLYIRVKVEVAKMWIGQFKPYFDEHIGKISTDFLSNTALRDQYVTLSFAFLVVLLLIEIILVLIEKSDFHTLLPRFITSLVASTAYVAIITVTITLANSFMGWLMGNNGSFIEFTQSTLNVLNLKQDSSTTLFNTIWSLFPGQNITNITGSQTKFVVDLLLIAFSIVPFIIGISQYISDIVISVMFLISPLVAITHIHGVKLPIIKNFWNIFFDLIVGKIALTLSYTFLVGQITEKINSANGGLNIGLAFFIIGSFVAMGAVTMAIREVFNIASNYAIRDQITTSASAPNKVIQSTTNVVSGGIQTINSLRRGI